MIRIKPKHIPPSPGVYPVRGAISNISLTSGQKKAKLFKQRLRHIPTSNGVYFFKNPRGKNLYIGKAANLKNRLSSYFSHKKTSSSQGFAKLDPRIDKMLELAVKVEWQETPSEIEALILESQLIKKNRPPFNIVLRDDKQYFFVVFTEETFPRLFITHQPPFKLLNIETSAVVGPFTEGTALRTTLKLLRRIFLYCTCKQKHHRRCLNYHLGKCLGFCCLKSEAGKSEKQIYQKNIRALKTILSGKKSALVQKLKKEMHTAAAQENFPKAIELRDKISKLERVFENARIILAISDRTDILRELQDRLNLPKFPRRIEGYDISNIQGALATGSMVVFTNGQPDKTEYRKFKIRRILSSVAPNRAKEDTSNQGGFGDTHMLKEILIRRFNHPEWPFPDLILIDGGKGQLNTAVGVLIYRYINTPVIALAKDNKHRGSHVFVANKKEPITLKTLPPAVANLILEIDSEAHRFAISYYRHIHRKSIR